MGGVLAPPAVAFVVFGTVKLLPGGRIADWGALGSGVVAPEGCAGGWIGSAVRWLATQCGGPGVEPTWLATLGSVIAAAALPATTAYLWRAARDPRLRSSVGVLWDVLTFWPRWNHPFAVRSYAERAVPELQWRIKTHLDAGRRIVLSAHSQGTVLVAAALAPLTKDDLARIAVVSFGSPLTTLYGRFFPSYFGRPEDFSDLCRRLGGRWRNFYRLTDYVGRDVAGVDGTVLADPATCEDPAGTVSGLLDEAPRVLWTSFAGHSAYRREWQLRHAVDAMCGASVQSSPPV